MNSNPIGRRMLLNWFTSSVAVATLAEAGSAGAAGPRHSADPLVNAIVDQFASPGSATVLGGEFLRQRPGEANIEILVGRIQQHADGDLRAIVETGDRNALKSALRECSRRDFEAGRTVSLHGAIMAETELRLCALVTIARSA